MRKLMSIVWMGLFLLGACNGGTNGPADMTKAADMTQGTGDGGKASCCGAPGDKGNSLGVGKYCAGPGLIDPACTGNTSATLCSTFGDPTTHFCTFACQADAGTSMCGDSAHCQCMPLLGMIQCGCVPDACKPDCK